MHLAYLHYLYGDDTAHHHVRQFSTAAQDLGHRVDVHAMNLASPASSGEGAEGPPPPFSAQLRGALKRRLAKYLHEPKELYWNLRYLRRERKLLSTDPPDVLLVRDHLITSSCVRVAEHLGRPLVMEMNAPAAESGLYLDEYFHLPWVAEALEGYKLRHAHGITVVSGALGEFLAERHGLDPEKITVVPNGADLARFHLAVTPAEDLPAALGPGPVVGFVGSFETWHGSDLLATMARNVGTARPETSFLFVGDGPEAPHLRSATAPLGDRIHFTGRVAHDRVPPLIAAFDIGVVAAAGFYMCPLKLIEWMAMGRAVVAPRQGPLEELIDDGVEGLLFEPRDPEALTNAVLRLVDDQELRRSLGTAAAARAHSSLSWTDNARRVLAACEGAQARYETPSKGTRS